MTPQTPVQNQEVPSTRRRVLTLGAIFVAATLVGTGAFMAIPDPANAPGNERLSQDHSLATPEAVLAEADRVLPGLALGDAAAATGAATDAQAALDAAARDAQRTLLTEAAAQQKAVARAAGATGSLPAVPHGWLPGGDVTAFVGPAGSAPFPAPALRLPTQVGGTTGLAEHAVGGEFATGSGTPQTGVAEVDAMTQQLGLLDGTYDALGGQELAGVLEGLGLPPLPAGLDGVVPASQAGDARGTVDPDDEGAQNALLFGYQVTDGVTGALGGLDGQADAVLAAQAGLLAQVEARAQEARDLEAEGVAAIDAELQKRLADAQVTTQGRLKALLEAHDAYVAAVEAAGADAQATLDAQVESARADVEAAAKAQSQALADEASRVLADAEARSAAVDAQASEYLALLADMEADGRDVTSEVAAIQAEAERLQADIQADAEAQQEVLLAAAKDLRAQVDAHLEAIDARAADLPDLQAEVDAAVAGADRALAFGQAVANARHQVVLATHAEAAKQATSDLHARADAHVEDLRASADAFLVRSEEFAASGADLVKQLQADGDEHVNVAADYVRKVADDYARVPAPERQANAEELLAEAETLTNTGLGVVASGDAVVQSFATVAQSSAGLRQELALLPL